jgi:hypothetical protein
MHSVHMTLNYVIDNHMKFMKYGFFISSGDRHSYLILSLYGWAKWIQSLFHLTYSVEGAFRIVTKKHTACVH